MMSSSKVIVLMVASLLLGTASANLLASHRAATSAQARSRAVSGLRSELAWLARSLSDLLAGGGVPASLAHAAARAQLARKADLLERQGHALKALLLHDLARRAPVEALVDVDDLEEAPEEATASSFSESTQVTRDAQGNVVTRTTRCKNGKCTKTESSSNRTEPSGGLAFGKNTPGAAGMAMDNDFTEASERMASQLEGIFNSFGLDGLHGMMDDIFGAATRAPSQLSWPFGSAITDGSGLFGGADAFEPRFDASMPMGSVSSSTVTKVVNGHMVQETTKCENGRCVKQTREEFGEPSMEEIDMEPLDEEVVVDEDEEPDWAAAAADAAPPRQSRRPMTILAEEADDDM